MDCKNTHKHFIGYAEHTLDSDTMEAVKLHLATCNDCAVLFSEIISTYKTTEQNVQPIQNPYFYTRVEQRLKNKQSHEVIAPQFAIRMLPIAASVLIAVAITLGVLVGRNFSMNQISTETAYSSASEKYASEYYLTATGEESIENLLTDK
jgi:hypothetical protein